MAEEKVFTPIVVQDESFPNGEAQTETIPASGKEVVTAPTINDTSFPTKTTANELVGSAINTQSKKILQEFQFTKYGAIQIGEYANGVSGDIRISPDGIVGRNSAGVETFTIDGTSGDAAFRGDVTVGGNGNAYGGVHVLDENNTERVTLDKDGIVVTDGKITVTNGTGSTIIDGQGIISDINSNFQKGYLSDNANITTTNGSFTDIANSTLTITLTRQSRVLLFIFAYGWNQDFRNNGDSQVEVQNYDSFTGQGVLNIFYTGIWYTKVSYQSTQAVNYVDFILQETNSIAFNELTGITAMVNAQVASNMAVVTMAAGTHNLKMQYRAVDGGEAFLYNWRQGYVVLGT